MENVISQSNDRIEPPHLQTSLGAEINSGTPDLPLESGWETSFSTDLSVEFRIISQPSDLTPYFHTVKEAPLLAIDTETTGLDPHSDRLRLIQISAPGIPVLVIDCAAFLPDGFACLKELLNTPSEKIFHNARFDLQFLMGIGIDCFPVFDTMLAAQLLRPCGGPLKAGLAVVADHYLGIKLDKTEQTGSWDSASLTGSQLAYAALDAWILLKLYDVMNPLLARHGLGRTASIEFACVSAIARAEYDGINLDLEKWDELRRKTEKQYDAALETLYTYSGTPSCQLTLWGGEEALDVNFESNPYVLKLLNRYGIPVTSTSRRSLAPYHSQPLVQALTEYRRHSKSLSSFLHPIPAQIHPVTHRLHPKYMQIGAWSGRMSCYNPNIQQIPREADFRSCFTAPDGRKLILADYSQIELRVAAQISGDSRMKSACQKGEDLHALTASLISSIPVSQVTKAQRQAAKAVNFGLIFGMGAEGLKQYAGQSYGVEMTLEEAEQFRSAFFQSYRGINWWHHDLRESHPLEGRTLTGRKFLFPPNTGLADLANTPVQGTAADILKHALGLLASRIRGSDKKIVAIVHDEILMEVPVEEADDTVVLLKTAMEEAAQAILPDVPCEADAKAADSWAGK